MNSKELGVFGEKIAERYLIKKGYKILDRNYCPKFVSGPLRGEIDIVAKPRRSAFSALQGKKNDIIHFIEVKTIAISATPVAADGRDRGGFFPEDKVNFSKQKKILKMAESWLMEKKIPLDSRWEVDVIAINLDLNSKKAKLRYLKNVAPY